MSFYCFRTYTNVKELYSDKSTIFTAAAHWSHPVRVVFNEYEMEIGKIAEGSDSSRSHDADGPHTDCGTEWFVEPDLIRHILVRSLNAGG